MRIALTALALLALPKLAMACPVCFGSADSAQTKAAQTGILALLVVTVAMLASIGGFFFVYLRRRIRMFEESNGGSF
jgi:predicted transcriptional regulator